MYVVHPTTTTNVSCTSRFNYRLYSVIFIVIVISFLQYRVLHYTQINIIYDTIHGIEPGKVSVDDKDTQQVTVVTIDSTTTIRSNDSSAAVEFVQNNEIDDLKAEIVSLQSSEDVQKNNIDDWNAEIVSMQSCDWVASNVSQKRQPCYDLLVNHLRVSLNESYTNILSQYNVTSEDHTLPRYVNRRWILLGDSTLYRLYAYSHLRALLMDQSIKQYQKQRNQYYKSIKNDPCTLHGASSGSTLRCRRIVGDRCGRVKNIGTIPDAIMMNDTSRVRPVIGEGPVGFGLYNPACTDCRGCDTKIVSCAIKAQQQQQQQQTDVNALNVSECTKESDSRLSESNNKIVQKSYYTGPAYGGFVAVEFARDVEIQSKQYTTTQENILYHMIQKEYNTGPAMIIEFGKPICVVNTGQHDIALPNITKEIYVQNMIWYLDLLNRQCDYILYISNNAPLTDDYAQTKALIYEWNIAVRDMLLRNANVELQKKSFFLDVYNASLYYDHLDNVHMARTWYGLLATFLSTVMNANFGVYQ